MKGKDAARSILTGDYRRKPVLVAFDSLCFVLVTAFYYIIARRAANSMPVDDVRQFVLTALLQLVCVFGCRFLVDVYSNVWRYDNASAYLDLVAADGLGSVLALCLSRFINVIFTGFYDGLWQMATIGSLFALLSLLSRFAYTLLYRREDRRRGGVDRRKPAVIVGAGRLGAALAAELQNNPNAAFSPRFFIDTDRIKQNSRVAGLPVYDERTGDELLRKLEIREVVVTVSSVDGEAKRALYHHYADLGCRVRVCDSLVGGDAGQTLKKGIRDFTVEELLFRQPIRIEDTAASAFYRDKVVLVTGGGGSIGSELCRQIARCQPRRLIIFDIYENNAYEIQQELRYHYGDTLDLVVEIGSVRDRRRVFELFRRYRPQLVLHAAAHKHVPLMEDSPGEAVKNNILGTRNAADAAEDCGAERFILISTDKAVNPTNIMGASKRVCEMLVQARRGGTSFSAVRFGNVLGSNGSVIPLFKKQIAAGGPVTVTDRRIIRYFMTIPEAAQLVMQAGALAGPGELMVLDMGLPVRIYDLARDMIRLSGLEPEVDIKIREIGLRPGEKLYEELLIKTEQLTKTANDMIFVETDTPLSPEELEARLALLEAALEQADAGRPEAVREALRRVVPTFRTPEEVNREAEAAREMQLAAVRGKEEETVLA